MTWNCCCPRAGSSYNPRGPFITAIQSQPRTGSRQNTSAPAPSPPPPLENGDRLTRDEFERRYHAMPPHIKAELVEGVVYMSSPVKDTTHSQPHFDLITWLGAYRAATQGVLGGDNGTLRLDLDNE